MSTNDTAMQIAQAFTDRFVRAWREGAGAVAQLYAPDAVLVGYEFATGRPDIEKLLGGVIGLGWTDIDIRIVSARAVGDTILVANAYTAIGSGDLAGKTLDSKSSQVLIREGETWLTTLHTAP